MPGKATAYTGAAIDGAKVRYRVVREVRFPIWCWWGWRSFRPGREQSQEIAHGTAATRTDGTFTVEFIAKPDLSAPEKDEPTFEFTVYADVTDTTGETRDQQRSVHVGYTALQATLSAAEWQTSDKPVEITVDTQDARRRRPDGRRHAEGVRAQAAGQGPAARVGFADISRHAERLAVDAGGGQEKADPSNPNSWELGEVVKRAGIPDRRQRQDQGVGGVKARHLSRDARNAGPLRQEGDRAAADPGR